MTTPPLRTAHTRWVICGLLLFAAIVNYIDRQVIAILKPTLEEQFGWKDDPRIYASIVFSFQLAYAIGFIFAGRFIDAVGVRLGFAIAVIVWSFAACLHGVAEFAPGWISLPALQLDTNTGFAVIPLVGAAAGFAIARFALGIGEAGAFPSSIKAVAEWFPRNERAFATGIFNSGTNIGALVAPLMVPFILTHWGWEWAFVATGFLGFIWVAWWLVSYHAPETHPKISREELAYIRSDPPDPDVRIPWLKLLPHRQTWAFAFGKFMTDPVWWLYLFWVPGFLNQQYKVSVTVSQMGPPLLMIYLIADVGSIGGGWLSSHWIKKGWSTNKARKMAMLVCALAVTPIAFAAVTKNVWVAVSLISLAAAAHQGWSANLFTLASDMFPRKAVGSVVGIGGMAGAVGGMFIAMLVGFILKATNNNYIPIFIIAASAYLIALLVIHLFAPRLDPAKLEVT